MLNGSGSKPGGEVPRWILLVWPVLMKNLHGLLLKKLMCGEISDVATQNRYSVENLGNFWENHRSQRFSTLPEGHINAESCPFFSVKSNEK